MNEQIFFITLIVLTIAHVIGDFRTPYRTFDRTSLKTMLLSEYVLVLNPLHGLWDAYSPFRRHPNYLIPVVKGTTPLPSSFKERNILMYRVDAPEDSHAASWYAQNCQFMTNSNKFWMWLGIDQAYHMLSNIFLAWLLGMIFQ